jgi:gliding motility-associated-like protein
MATATVTILEPAVMVVTGITLPTCGDLGIAEATIAGGTGPYTYVWSPLGGTDPIADSLTAGTYTCDVTDVNGCTGSTIVNVITFPFPIVTVTADTTIKYGELIRLNAFGATNYSWSPPINLSCSDCEDPIATLSETTTYCVTGNNGACIDSACVTITLEIDCGDVFVPSAFSPNNDGENDLVCAYGNCLESFVFVIYNRWGEKVFESSDKNTCWDGTWKGKELNSAVFVYILEGTLITNEKVTLKGNISLIR